MLIYLSHQCNLLKWVAQFPSLMSQTFLCGQFTSTFDSTDIRFVYLGKIYSETFTDTHKAVTLSLWQFAAKCYL
jgi:hypothetical protein